MKGKQTLKLHKEQEKENELYEFVRACVCVVYISLHLFSQIDIHEQIFGQIARSIDGKTDRHVERQADCKEAERQSDTWITRQKDRCKYIGN